jgi:exodeoxyribonuclease VII large subunit
MIPPTSQRSIFTVSQLNRFIRNWLEQDMGLVHIEGEISNATQASSGHCYFTLKDSTAQLRCVFFKNRHTTGTKYTPTNGQLVIAQGKLSLYEARGDYQLIVETLEEAGIGDLFRAFQLLKTKLAAEGLFDASRKKSIPSIPQCIGIITSSSGAALHDIATTLARRYPLAPTVLYASDVQGAQAALQLIQAIERANQENRCDVLILARGGGSLEDLWPFNNEQLAHSIANSKIPIVTGIGHETDFTIADFVADYRAATPTAAAEKVTPHWQQLHELFQRLEQRLQTAIQHLFQQKKLNLAHCIQQLSSPKRLIHTHWQTIDYLTRRLSQSMQQQLTQKQHAVRLAAIALDSLSPLATLARGYAIASHRGVVIKSNLDVVPGDSINLQLKQGTLMCEVKG